MLRRYFLHIENPVSNGNKRMLYFGSMVFSGMQDCNDQNCI